VDVLPQWKVLPAKAPEWQEPWYRRALLQNLRADMLMETAIRQSAKALKIQAKRGTHESLLKTLMISLLDADSYSSSDD